MEPLVSIVLPTYNRAKTIPRAMASVLNQSYRNLELLVVDDASTDDTADVVARLGDPRVRYIRLPRNGGASHARNEGMRLAEGDYIAFQDSDDEWLSDKLRRLVEAAQASGDAAVTVFHTKILYGRDSAGTYGPHKACCLPAFDYGPDTDFRRLIHRMNLVSPQALMISREAFRRAGYFNEDLVNNEDWLFGIELFYSSTVVFVDEPLVMTYLQSDSVSMRPGFRAQLRIMQKLRKLPESTPANIGAHLGRLGWGLSKAGYGAKGRRLLRQAISQQPLYWKHWARFAATMLRVGRPPHRP